MYCIGVVNSEKYFQSDNNSLKISVMAFMNSEKYTEFGNSSGIYEL